MISLNSDMGDCGEDDDPEDSEESLFQVDESGKIFGPFDKEVKNTVEESEKEDDSLIEKQLRSLAAGIACSQTIIQKGPVILAAVESILSVGQEVKDFVFLIISIEEEITKYFDQDSVSVVDGDEEYVMKIVAKDSLRESLAKVDEVVVENMDNAEALSVIIFKNGVIATFDSRDILFP